MSGPFLALARGYRLAQQELRKKTIQELKGQLQVLVQSRNQAKNRSYRRNKPMAPNLEDIEREIRQKLAQIKRIKQAHPENLESLQQYYNSIKLNIQKRDKQIQLIEKPIKEIKELAKQNQQISFSKLKEEYTKQNEAIDNMKKMEKIPSFKQFESQVTSHNNKVIQLRQNMKKYHQSNKKQIEKIKLVLQKMHTQYGSEVKILVDKNQAIEFQNFKNNIQGSFFNSILQDRRSKFVSGISSRAIDNNSSLLKEAFNKLIYLQGNSLEGQATQIDQFRNPKIVIKSNLIDANLKSCFDMIEKLYVAISNKVRVQLNQIRDIFPDHNRLIEAIQRCTTDLGNKLKENLQAFKQSISVLDMEEKVQQLLNNSNRFTVIVGNQFDFMKEGIRRQYQR